MIEVKGLEHSFPGHPSISFPDISLEKGEAQLVLGDSGSGKTTFLQLLGGLLSIQQGHVSINGQDISDLSSAALDKFRGKNIGFIFQKAHLVQALTVEENLLLGQMMAGKKQDKAKVKKLLTSLNLESKQKAKVKTLSQGQAQRVVIARALINDPEIVLADEPTSSLDDKNAEAVIELIKRATQENNSSLLITTHDKRVKDHFEKQIVL